MRVTLFALLLLLLVVQAHAATYQVSPTGSDSTPCAQAPRRTINGGIACLSPGDTLVVQAGDYDELLTNASGMGYGMVPIPSDVTIRAAQPGTVTLRVPAHRPGHWSALVAFGAASQDITLVGLRLVDEWQLEVGVEFEHARGIHLVDVEITGFRGQGIQGNRCDDCTFTNMNVHAIARRDGQTTCGTYVCGPEVRDAQGMCSGYCHGIYLGGTNLTIEGGRLYDIDGYGLHLYPRLSNSTIRNTCVWGNGSTGIGLFGGDGNTVERVRVWDNGYLGLWNHTTGSTLRHSHLSGNREGDLLDQTGSLVVEGTQLGGGGSAPADCGASGTPPPVVVLPAPKNLRLLQIGPTGGNVR